MASPQTGIFALGTAAHAYLEFDVLPSADAGRAVASVARLREPRTTIGGVNLVAGNRPELWAVVAPHAAPTGVVGLNEPIRGAAARDLPATQHDIVVWIAGASYDVVFDTSRAIVAELSRCATLAHEVVGWQYHHDRDLTGFVDGTENPSVVEAMSVALVPSGLIGEGSSLLLLQQWAHDAINWEALPVGSQEAIIGRRNSDSEELDPRPPTSHVARTDQDRFGKIFRRNVAYGTVSDHGTIFVGFCASQGPLREMLESMVGRGSEPPDQLTSVARAVTGAYYVIPTADRLAAFGLEDRADGQ
jgi:putative iron-dependent peroxidase